jgi:hypothetical protein
MLVQVPFLILLNRGHSAMGAIGYAFYYPIISMLDWVSKPWGYTLILQELELFVFQSLFLGAITFTLIFFKKHRRPNPRTTEAISDRDAR